MSIIIKTKDDVIRTVDVTALRRIPYFGDLPAEFFVGSSPDNIISCPISSADLDIAMTITNAERRDNIFKMFDYIGIPVADTTTTSIRPISQTVLGASVMQLLSSEITPSLKCEENFQKNINDKNMAYESHILEVSNDPAYPTSIPRRADAMSDIYIAEDPKTIPDDTKLYVWQKGKISKTTLKMLPITNTGLYRIVLSPEHLEVLTLNPMISPLVIYITSKEKPYMRFSVSFIDWFIQLPERDKLIAATSESKPQYVYEDVIEFENEISLPPANGICALFWETETPTPEVQYSIDGQSMSSSNFDTQKRIPIMYGYRPYEKNTQGCLLFGANKEYPIKPTCALNKYNSFIFRTNRKTKLVICRLVFV